MSDNKELIHKLINMKDQLDILQGMLNGENRRLEQELNLANEARRIIDSLLYELTGDEFYRN
jgi:hypothetical protein